jgi:DNA-binding response OmpR family regulator
VVDLRLPDRQGGAVLQRLRSQDGPAWVAISALDRQEAEKEYGPLGSNFLTKPFDPWDLIRKLGELLQR